ncbi:hypothetical protein ACLI1A_02335 [Flavobacterium sp. RHBU_3]|uniref:hypothetical protein n=1 Tax=Flavobacterium sp. RHBU_3 TaxID=3391184 RepID=UPI0039852540
MKNTLLRAMVLGCVLTAATGFAQDKTTEKPQRNGEKMFEKLDADGDGKLSKDEVAKAERPMLKDKFDEIDTNKDKYLDKDELKAFREKQMANRKKKEDQ